MTDRRYFWPIYAGLLGLVAALCFGSLRTHLLDTHDAQTFRDHERIATDFAFFLSPLRRSGRPGREPPPQKGKYPGRAAGKRTLTPIDQSS
ncbi:MAG TPA: hypothetical protein EYM39_11305 [Candidatus Latescibacteria bacterium]|nr:hypothetical protein [Candidatus Latescibacterota bacterium]